MRNVIGLCICLCVVALVVGILIGGSLEATVVPNNNQITMEVMPYGDVNVTTHPGDTIGWRASGQKKLPTINFLGNGVTPCTGANNPCTISSNPGNGIYLYDCTGNASCPDPGVGPITTSGPLTLFGEFIEKFNGVVRHIARVLGFFEASRFRTQTASATSGGSGEAPKPGVTQRPANRTSGEVACSSSNQTVAPTISVSPNGSILWASPNDFTITIIGATICNEDLSTQRIWQLCTLKNVASGQTYQYTATENACSAQHESAQAQITIQ